MVADWFPLWSDSGLDSRWIGDLMARLEGLSIETPDYLCRWLDGVRCVGDYRLRYAISSDRKTGDTIPPKDTHFLMYKPLVEWDK